MNLILCELRTMAEIDRRLRKQLMRFDASVSMKQLEAGKMPARD